MRNAQMEKYEQRRIAVVSLVASMGHGGIAKVAHAISKAPDYVSRMLYEPGKAGRKRIGEDTWDALAAAYPDQLHAAAPHHAAPDLLAFATPRSRRALEHIIATAEAGRLTEADLTLLESIAQRIASLNPGIERPRAKHG